MNNKKVRGLIWFVLLSCMIGGVWCRLRDDKAAREEADARKKMEFYDNYWLHEHDSFCEANHRPDFYATLEKRSDVSRKYSAIAYPKTLSGTMESELRDRGWPIVSKAEEKIKALLNKSGIEYDGCFKSKNSEAFFTQLFVGINRDSLEILGDCGPQYWQKSVDSIVDNSDLDSVTKAQIKNSVGTIINSADSQVIAERTGMERKYRKYNVAVDKETMDNLGLSRYVIDGYKSNTYFWGYWALNRAQNNDFLVKYNTVRVLSQNLEEGFFADSTAKYEFVRVSSDKGQFIKKLANGTVEKTPVVECDTNSAINSINEFYWPECTDVDKAWKKQTPKVGDTKLSTKDGNIVYVQVVDVVPMKKWATNYTVAEKRQTDSLLSIYDALGEELDRYFEVGNAAREFASAKTAEAQKQGFFEKTR